MKILKVFGICMIVLLSQYLKAQVPNWSINPSDYQYTMSIMGVGMFDCEQTVDPNDIVGAFIDDSLAGFANFNTIVGPSTYGFLTVYSNVISGETIEFKLYDASTGQLEDAKFGSVFQENASVGGASNPFEFKTDYDLEDLTVDIDTLFDYTMMGDTISVFALTNELQQEEIASYSFVNDATGVDNISFSFQNEYLVIEEDADYITQSTYHIHVLATSVSGCTYDKSFVLTVFNTNVPPTDIIENPTYIKENLEIGSFVGLLEAVDATPIDFHTYELIGSLEEWPDNYTFEINYDELLSLESYDYETQKEYSLQIEVTDATGNSYVDTFTVLIEDVIEFEELKAPNYISPNGDGINDYFIIENVELYWNYGLYFYNDNGNLVYSKEENYDNSFSGIANKGNELSSATYYYYFVNKDNSEESFKGKLFIERPTKY